MFFNRKYLPTSLSRSQRKKQAKMLLKSKKMYKQKKYFTRSRVSSNHTKSNHIKNAQAIYHVDKITPSQELASKTGCTISSMKQIVKKGEGAYYSSGSRPNQTPQSWGLARLASAITGGKSAAVDYSILKNGCDPNKRAFRLATQAKKKYGYGRTKTKKVSFSL